MKLIIGLGNPSQQYEKTRHNVGFMAINYLQNKLEFPKFKLEKKFKAAISDKTINHQKIILAKPMTFVNQSGKAVQLLKKFYKIKNQDIYIIRDDIDLTLDKIRSKQNSGSGGHQGINSIINNLKSKNFTQIKIGVKTPLLEKMNPATFVLQKFTKTELVKIQKVISAIEINL